MLNASVFLTFVNQVWPGDYDIEKTQNALSKTQNITAYDGDRLVGCLRILSDGYFFGTITELLVLPDYQNILLRVHPRYVVHPIPNYRIVERRISYGYSPRVATVIKVLLRVFTCQV